MKLLKLFILMSLVLETKSQKIYEEGSIWFIQSPTVLKNTGVIKIYINSPTIIPQSVVYDSTAFIDSVKTNTKTLFAIQEYITKSKYIRRGSFKLRPLETFWTITDIKGFTVFLLSRDNNKFFKGLKLLIKKNKLDSAVINVLP